MGHAAPMARRLKDQIGQVNDPETAMNMKTTLLGFGLLAAGLVRADTPLFSVGQELAKSSPTQERTWAIDWNADALRSNSQSLLIAVPGKPPQRAWRTSFESRDAVLVWRGRIGQRPVLVHVSGNSMHAEFHVGLDHYVIASQQGRSVLALTSRRDTRTDALNLVEPSSAPEVTAALPTTLSDPTVITVLVAYTEAAEFSAGGEADIIAAAGFMVAQLNGIVAGSVATDLRFEMAGRLRLGYADGIDSATALQTLASDPDVAIARDAFAADIVVGVLENTDFAGRAYLPTQIGIGNAAYAFAVVSRHYALNYYTFAHEVGHVFGLDHGSGSPEGNTGAGIFPWAQGHVGPFDEAAGFPEGFVTVMAPIGLCGGSPPCYEVPYFSNPELTNPEQPVRGRSLGLVDAADNALAMRLAASTIAAYRESVPDPDLIVLDGFEQ